MKKFLLILCVTIGLLHSYAKTVEGELLYVTYHTNGNVKDVVIKKDHYTFEVASFYSNGELSKKDSENLVYLLMDYNKAYKGKEMSLQGAKSNYSTTLFFTDGIYIYLISTKQAVDTFLGYIK